MRDRSENDHHRGLAFDLETLVNRRSMLGLMGGTALATLVGCSAGDDDPAPAAGSATQAPATASGGTTTAAGKCAELPEETAGPFPGDGSNGPDVLAQSGMVRGDIRSSFGTASGVAAGVPLSIRLTVVDHAKGCAPYPGAAVYVWHCDREGRYSMYSSGADDQNYLRGVQAAGTTGEVVFTSIFPAAYQGRWPHIHFEVYPNVATATTGSGKVLTSQLALPQKACEAVYATPGYESSVRNLANTSLSRDNVFSDGYETQLATVTGSASAGYVARLTVPV